MPVADSHSTLPDLDDAVSHVCGEVRASLQGVVPDLLFVFVSHDHADHFDALPRMLQRQLGPKVLLGCAAETVIGGMHEIEEGPALCIWAGVFPEMDVTPFHVEFAQTPDGLLCTGLPADSGEAGHPARAVLVLTDPYSSVPNSLFARMGDALPGVALSGGMASGGQGPMRNALFLDDECLRNGGVGVLASGPRIRTIVSQGCRPIGRPFVVTAAERNVIRTLGGQAAARQFEEMMPEAPERDRQLARRGLHLGIAVNEYQERFERGDFLVANVLGADPDSGAIAIANEVRVGQTVQFHVRDAETAHEDLREMLEQDRRRHPEPAAGVLLFSCNGRGTRLFGFPNHDARLIQQVAGPLPLAGFFAQGEYGPVGMRNCIHGFTASVAMFE